MVKTKEEVAAKMTERVGTAGKYLQAGMDAAEDPLEILNKDPAAAQKAYADGVAEGVRKGNYGAGIKKALADNAWQKSKERAGRHFEERKDDMVTNAMKDYDGRAKVIESAQKAVEKMPSATRAQRIAKSAKYQEEVGKGFDAMYGRKA